MVEAMIPRIRINDLPPPSTPWIADWRSYDIPETVAAGIRAASSWGNCVSIYSSSIWWSNNDQSSRT